MKTNNNEAVPVREYRDPSHAQKERIASQMIVAYNAMHKIQMMTDSPVEDVARTIARNAQILEQIVEYSSKLKSLKFELLNNF